MRKSHRTHRSRMVLGVVVAIVLALVATAVGAVVPRSAVTAATGGAATSLSLARPGGVQAGDVLLAAVSYRLDGGAAVGTPAGWALVRADTCSGPRDTVQTQRTYYRVATGSESGSYTWSFGNAAGAVGAVVAYSGVDTSSPIAAHNGDRTRNSAWVRALGVSSPIANGMVVAILGRSSAVGIPTPNGMNARASASTTGGPTGGLHLADVIQPASGETGNKPSKTSEIASCNIGQLVVLRPGAGPVTPPPAPVVTKPSNTGAPVLTGTPQVGSTMTVTNGVWSGTSPMAFSYQWQKCAASCVPITGATARTYTPSASDVNTALRATVVASNGAGTATGTSTSSATVTEVPVAVTPPTAVGSPAVSGSTQVGAMLTTTNGSWTGTTPMTYSRQWWRCQADGTTCVEVPGATGTNYSAVSEDRGKTLRASVRATNAAGSDTSTSAVTAVVTDPPVVPPPPGPPAPPPPSPSPPPPPPPASSDKTVIVENGTWECDGPVDLDLVKVTRPPGDAIRLGEGCTGRIGRIEVDTWSTDGVKVANAGSTARDLQIGGGYVKCHGMNEGAHQDAVQAMGGSRITFRNVAFDCLGNSNFFVQAGGSGASTPTDIVCEGCRFAGNSATSVFIGSSVRSGIRNSVVCEGRFRDIYINAGTSTSPIDTGNVVVPRSDSRCNV